jgi:hypothetical protein
MLQELQHLLDAQFPEEAGLAEFDDVEVPDHVHL